jgi:hypothetical protein
MKNSRQCRHLRFLRRITCFIGKTSQKMPILKEEDADRKEEENGRNKTKKRS